jgi:hypothetical protein
MMSIDGIDASWPLDGFASLPAHLAIDALFSAGLDA